MKRKHVVVIVLNLCIAFGYYFGNNYANETHLSSDLHNIIPVCLKKDDPSLFPFDTFANDLDNVKYYTPFYVETLRFFANFTGGNYVQALNLLTFICHILFGLLWYFLLFRLTKNFWIALFVSILLRGIVWIPGLEYWGISDLWSLLPRVVYYALLPLPFLLFQYKNNTRYYIAAFLIGLIFNFHPITGLSGIIIYVGFLIGKNYEEKKKWTVIVNQRIISAIVVMILGMLPFFITYLTNVSAAVDYDLALYKQALEVKFNSFLTEPTTFWRQWLQLKYAGYFSVVVVFIIVAFTKGTKQDKVRSKYMLGLLMLLFVIPNLSAYVEQVVNALFGLNIRMSFQLVRMQKLMILAVYFAIAFLLDMCYRNKNFKKIFPAFFGAFLVLLVISKHSVFDAVPLASNDMMRRVLPNSLSVGNIKNGQDSEDLALVLKYIRENTSKDALFFAPDIGRSGGRRSVVLDSKGANMLIEGNPKRFVKWYQDYQKFTSLSPLEANQFLRNYGVGYVLIYIELPEFELLFKQGKWRLYKVN